MVDLRAPGALRLGFGCAGLSSDLSYRASCALIESAYDSGFRHFDVAPSYGHGLAERVVGEVLSPVRDSVSISTKAGIPHPQPASGLRALRPFLLPLKRLLPAMWKGVANTTRRATVPRGRFGSQEIAASIHESLSRLQTGYVDFLLLHEVQPVDTTAELFDTLAHFRTDGRLLGIGLGTSVEASLDLLEAYPGFFDLVQVNHYWGAFRAALVGDYLLVTHRCIRAGTQLIESQELQQVLATDDTLSDVRQVLDDQHRAPDLLLAAALAANREGMVLVSSSRQKRVRHFIEVAQSSEWAALACQFNRCLQQISGRMHAPEG